MKVNAEALNNIKKQIEQLKGNSVNLRVNRGRKKFEVICGVVDNIYPSVFTVLAKDCLQSVQTFSYFDVLCGIVVFETLA